MLGFATVRLQSRNLQRVLAERGHPTGSITGTEASPAGKVWNVLNGLGSMAFAVQFGIMTLEVQVRNYSCATCTDTALYKNKTTHWPKLDTCGASLSLQGGPVLSHTLLTIHLSGHP